MPGLGGSFGYADLAAGIGYAYAPNKWRLTLFGDPRDVALRAARSDALRSYPRRRSLTFPPAGNDQGAMIGTNTFVTAMMDFGGAVSA